MELLINAGQAAEKTLERTLIRRWDLTYPQCRVLKHLAAHGSTTMGVLAGAMGCSRGNLTGVTDRLVRDGWISRERSNTDRRVVDVGLLKDAEFREVEQWMDEQPKPPASVSAWLEEFVGAQAQATV